MNETLNWLGCGKKSLFFFLKDGENSVDCWENSSNVENLPTIIVGKLNLSLTSSKGL